MSPRDFFRQLWAGQRLLVSVVVLLLVLNLAAWLTLQLYLAPTVTAGEQHMLQRQAELRGEASSSDTPAQRLADGDRDLGIFRGKIPAYREFTGLLTELEEMAGQAGLEFGHVTYKNEQATDLDLLRYTLNFTLAGGYRDIKQFVHALEQSSRLMVLREIGLQGGGQDNDETEVRLQLSLETFFRPGES